MHEQIAALRPCLDDVRTERRAGRDFHLGRLDGHDAILVRCNAVAPEPDTFGRGRG